LATTATTMLTATAFILKVIQENWQHWQHVLAFKNKL